jgi:hypothetical protein
MKLKVGWPQAIGPKGLEQLRYSSRERHVIVGKCHTERVADAEFWSQGVGVTSRLFENSFDKISNKIDRCAGGVLQMKPGANAGVKGQLDGAQIDVRGL